MQDELNPGADSNNSAAEHSAPKPSVPIPSTPKPGAPNHSAVENASSEETAVERVDRKAAAAEVLNANGITVEWLNDALASVAGGATIVSVDSTAIGTGQVGENVRCKLAWSESTSRQASELPASVVLKLPSLDEVSRATAAATSSYVREVGFYRDAASNVALRIPKTFFISEDLANNSFALVMEDIAPASQGEQLDGCTIEQARLAVSSAAQLHGSTWNASWTTNLEWIHESGEDRAMQHAGLFAMVFPGFMDRYGQRLSSAERAQCQWLSDNIEPYLKLSNACDTQALVHGDFRLDNMLFGPTPNLVVVDWQTAAVQCPIADVAYFVGTSVDRDQQSDLIPSLLDSYQAELELMSVTTDRSWLERHVGLHAPGGLIMAVIASQIVGQTDRGDDMFTVMAKGSANLMDLTNTKDRLS